MKKFTTLLFRLVLSTIMLSNCAPDPAQSSTITPVPSAAASAPPTATQVLPTPTRLPPTQPLSEETIVVSSTADGGPATLRQALLDAQSGYTITFDPAVFPPNAPATIFLTSALPPINQGNLTIDASSAGVILDGHDYRDEPAIGLQIYSDGNTIQGLQIINFSEAGIIIGGQAEHNTIGGDRNLGAGLLGQGNLISANNIGIGIWDPGAAYNTIIGNLIGTKIDGETAWSNHAGVYISEGANHNIIGPGNVIAYNFDYGIAVFHTGSLNNTLTQNSVHSNIAHDIGLEDGGNRAITAPFIIAFDAHAGTIAGSTCANCTVEIFSSNGSGGEVYEGQTRANGTGVFTFEGGIPFTGAHLTSTATDADGNTSTFSNPTSGPSGTIALQTGNYLPMIPLLPKRSHELEDNHLGDMYSLYPLSLPEHPNFEHPDDFANRINEKGLKWMRTSIDMFDWNEIEEIEAYSKYYVDPLQDQAINNLKENGISVLYTLVFWDKEIKTSEGYSRFQSDDEIQDFLDYIQFIVDHFRGHVDYYALLNEPNIGFGTQQYVESADYINLVRRAVPVIRKADPDVKIIIGEVTPLIWPDSIQYLFDILRSDVLPQVDGISWHAAGWASPEFKSGEYYNYQSLVQEIKKLATENGFTGEFWATEMHWRTSESPHESEYDEYSGKSAAKYLARGILMHLGIGFIPGIAENLEHIDKMPVIQNLCTLMAGAEPLEIVVEIESGAPHLTNYNFELSNGDILIAAWSDSIAIDNDPGVNSTMVIPDLSAENVTGIDILNSFEQELIFSVEDGNLVIRDLLIRDYPIILRIIEPTAD